MEFRTNIENIENNKMALYRVTRAAATNLQDHVGNVIRVMEWCYFKDGEGERQREVLTIVADDGVIYRTISPVFKRSFNDIVTNFYVQPEISVISGVSKSDRKFIDCQLIGDAGGEAQG